jgi:hypothetical protein
VQDFGVFSSGFGVLIGKDGVFKDVFSVLNFNQATYLLASDLFQMFDSHSL